jgi:hypothetical protein
VLLLLGELDTFGEKMTFLHKQVPQLLPVPLVAIFKCSFHIFVNVVVSSRRQNERSVIPWGNLTRSEKYMFLHKVHIFLNVVSSRRNEPRAILGELDTFGEMCLNKGPQLLPVQLVSIVLCDILPGLI